MAAADEFFYSKIMDTVAKSGGLDDSFGLMDSLSRSMGGGAEYSRFNDLFYGLNRLPNISPLPLHRESQGLVLFTRPNLNLSYDNIALVRSMAHFLTQDPTSYQYAIRMMLDPTTYSEVTAPASPLVDARMPYLTLLSNSVQTMSSPPDIGINIYASPEGAAKEVWIMNDSICDYNGKYDLTLTFNNYKGNAVPAMIQLWLTYMSALRVGPCVPHPQQRAQNEMDYFTRIERYKLDIHGRKIVQWFHTGAAVPTNCSMGAPFGYNREESQEFENKQFSVQFAAVGAVYNDPIQLLEFNLRIQAWCADMQDAKRESKFTKVPYAYRAACNFNGYPRINLANMELEWWVDKNEYQNLIKGL